MLRRSARIVSRACVKEDKNRLLNQLKTFSTKSLTVKHDNDTKLFYVELGNDKAVIEYSELENDTLDLYHTEVPSSFQGLGVAKVLAKAAFDHCVENDLKMKLTCEYLQKYFRENKLPKYSNLVVGKE